MEEILHEQPLCVKPKNQGYEEHAIQKPVVLGGITDEKDRSKRSLLGY
jgi:hypothetical protein